MNRPGWYIVAYDIADPKRLQKIHRMLKKEGLPVQKSVFFVHGGEKSVERLVGRLEQIIDRKRDDIRAYPVTHPGEVWTTGGPLGRFPLSAHGLKQNAGSKTDRGSRKKEKVPWYRKLFG